MSRSPRYFLLSLIFLYFTFPHHSKVFLSSLVHYFELFREFKTFTEPWTNEAEACPNDERAQGHQRDSSSGDVLVVLAAYPRIFVESLVLPLEEQDIYIYRIM